LEFYSRKNGDNKELLSEHLKQVSLLCGSYTSDFTSKEIGEFLGMAHDSGKMTQLFQDVLFGTETNINHAIIGGIWPSQEKSFATIMKTDAETMDFLSDVIVSHHSSLKRYGDDKEIPSDWSFPIYGKKYSVSNDDEYIDICKHYGNSFVEGEFAPINYTIKDASFDNKANEMLYQRMLLSCLIDADYSSSAMFYDKNYLQNTEKHLPFSEHLRKLNNFREKLISTSDSRNIINQIRQSVYEDCSNIQILNDKNGGLFSLTGPTSSGKTLAMINFALQQAIRYNKKRIFFVLPYLSIISQCASIYKDIFGEEFVLEDDSQSELCSPRERELVNRWTTDINITTNVKFLETFFKNSASDLRKLHNIVNSVIVIDEYQSIPPHLLQTTTNILRELANRYGCIILFASATPPNYSFRNGIKWWDREVKEVINDVDGLFEKYSKNKKLNIHWCLDKKETYDTIAKKISAVENVAVICNTKKSAKKTYKKLLQYKKQDECFLLSSDLCNKHKLEVIEEIIKRQELGLPLFVVSTQCIEAGVDISFDFMYRELAPLHSIVQAGGRCDRHCKGNGHLFIFCFEEESNPDISYKNAKKQTQILLSEFKNGIDIGDLSALAEYYKKLYTLNYFSKDKEELLTAIENFDFDEVCKQFRVIENKDQIHIIVPHDTETKLFNSVLNDFEINGTTDIKNLKKLQKITVNSYDENLKNACKPLLFSTKRNPEGIDFGFYVLLPNTIGIHYDKKLGLNIEETKLIL